MGITDAIVLIIAELAALGNGLLVHWVDMPANASSPLDPNVTLTGLGDELAGYLASAGVRASDILAAMVEALF